MFALHAGYVAEREHHGVQAALHGGGMGTAVLLQLHHLCRRGLPRAGRCSGLEAALPHLQRPRRVSPPTFQAFLHLLFY